MRAVEFQNARALKELPATPDSALGKHLGRRNWFGAGGSDTSTMPSSSENWSASAFEQAAITFDDLNVLNEDTWLLGLVKFADCYGLLDGKKNYRFFLRGREKIKARGK